MSRRRNTNRSVSKEDSGFKPVKLSGRTDNQIEYIKSLLSNEVVICNGPAGTGKTFCAVGVAIKLLREKVIQKIYLTRPAVSMGRDIGYLPGDMLEKMAPYMRPFYDQLFKFCEPSKIKLLFDSKLIEVVPITTMRGATFDDCVVLADELQNAEIEELRMLMTRIGDNCRLFMTGDISQSDLPHSLRGGFRYVFHEMAEIDGIDCVNLHARDIVRNALIAEIDAVFNRREFRPERPANWKDGLENVVFGKSEGVSSTVRASDSGPAGGSEG